MPRSLMILFLTLAGLLADPSRGFVQAQESKEASPRRATPSRPESFFAKPEIDFWGTGGKKKPLASSSNSKREPSAQDRTESLFAEPTRLPDGRTTVYVPPAAVLAFLDNPTKENARAYLEWQNARSKKIAAALEALEAAKREDLAKETGDPDPKTDLPKDEGNPRVSDTTQPQATVKQPARGVRVTYFRQAG